MHRATLAAMIDAVLIRQQETRVQILLRQDIEWAWRIWLEPRILALFYHQSLRDLSIIQPKPAVPH